MKFKIGEKVLLAWDRTNALYANVTIAGYDAHLSYYFLEEFPGVHTEQMLEPICECNDILKSML